MRAAWFAPVILALATLVGGSTAFAQSPVDAAQSNPPAAEFRLGFKALAGQIPDTVGSPLEDEHYGDNGDSLQRTTTGLMVWRKADNWTAFTDGARSWLNGPSGVQSRGNNGRFAWESPATPIASDQGEVTLYDRQSTPTAYLALNDDNTIYLWTGEPIAYLVEDHVYGFNGRHIGWFQDGIIWDWEPVAVGFTGEAQGGYHKADPEKSPKLSKPAKLPREAAPIQPSTKTRDVFTTLLLGVLRLGLLP